MNVTPDTDDGSAVDTVNWPVVRRLGLIAGGILACCVGMLLYSKHQERRAEAIEWAVAKTPVGASYDAAEQRIGRPPDFSDVGRGVITHGGAVVYDVSNSKATQHGKLQMYDIHLWREGPVSAMVLSDRNGIVIGRSSWRERPKASGPSLVQKLVRWIQSQLQ